MMRIANYSGHTKKDIDRSFEVKMRTKEICFRTKKIKSALNKFAPIIIVRFI